MPSRLFRLSTEILVEIFFLLRPRDIIACSETCSQLRTLVHGTPLLQYVTYAHRAGVEDSFPPGFTIPERFSMLWRWEAAWNNIDAQAPSGGRLELPRRPGMRTVAMLRNGFLVVALFNGIATDEIPSYSTIDLRSPTTGWQHFELPGNPIAFDCSIEQDVVAWLNVPRFLPSPGDLLYLILHSINDPQDYKFVTLGYKPPFRMVDLKIAGGFVGVMSCREATYRSDAFWLVDLKDRTRGHKVLCKPSPTYAASFCFLNHQTVAHINMLDNTIEVHRIVVTGDGRIFLEPFQVYNNPVATIAGYRRLEAAWGRDHPTAAVSSPVVWPEDREHPSSRLPFQSSLEDSFVCLSVVYEGRSATDGLLVWRIVRAIIPRAELLCARPNKELRSFRLLCQGSLGEFQCSISGSRWINNTLEICDFNRERARSASAVPNVDREPTADRRMVAQTNILAGSPFKQDASTSIPFCQTIPRNQLNPDDSYGDVLMDDERIVGLRYERNDDGQQCIAFDVWTL